MTAFCADLVHSGYPNVGVAETLCRLLLQSPKVPFDDLPWVSICINDNGEHFKAHLQWGLRVLRHGVARDDDVLLIRRRRLVQWMCTHYYSGFADGPAQHSIRLVLLSIAGYPKGAAYLVDHCAIFPWIVSMIGNDKTTRQSNDIEFLLSLLCRWAGDEVPTLSATKFVLLQSCSQLQCTWQTDAAAGGGHSPVSVNAQT